MCADATYVPLHSLADGDGHYFHPENAISNFNEPNPPDIAHLLDENQTHKTLHSCAYCGLDAASSVVKCGTCDRWFCNGSNLRVGSHIVTHLVLLKHNVVSLHAELPLGADTLECYNCGCKNVFMLGFVAAKQESVVVLLCRIPCAQLRDINWETNEWQPLIDQRKLLLWVATEPLEDAMVHTRAVTHDQIAKLEAQWRLNRDTTIDDIDGADAAAAKLSPVLLRYTDAYEYQNTLAPLVDAEAECDRALKESQALEHIVVQWGVGANGRHTALFALLNYEHSNLVVAVGDEIVLHYRAFGATDDETWTGEGYIVRLPSARLEVITLELLPLKSAAPITENTGFTAEFVWKGTSYNRMQKALRDFATDEKCLSGFLYHKMLGHEVVAVEFDSAVPGKLAVPKIANLNSSQLHAVTTALKMPLLLIQGPPGTGKTVTSATIIYHLTKMHKHRILVCAPSNVAVDHLTEKLAAIGIKVVRLVAKSRESMDAVQQLTLPYSLHEQTMKVALPQLKKLVQRKENDENLSKKQLGQIQRSVHQLEQQVLAAAQVVCCTCVGAGDFRLKGMKFRLVLIDELTQATEPEVLIPITKGAKQVILVGDHQQLGPVILDKNAAEAGLQQSLFERLICHGQVPIRLEVQYRMNPALSEFSSNMFYEGSLQNGVTSEDRAWRSSLFPWPVPDCPMMFWANYGKEEISSSGNSFLNRVEAMNVEKIITRLFRDGVRPDQIGVITPYEGQRAYIVQYMQMNSLIVERRADYVEVEITSVDAFQGREKDFIILSCVRANDERAIGFLKDPRRLNVALTRAKYGMAVLGNPRSLSKNRLWNYLLTHFRERGCLVEGPLDNLQLSMVPLGKIEQTKQGGFGPLKNNFSRDFDQQLMMSFVPDEIPEFHTDHVEEPWEPREPTYDDEKWPLLTLNEAGKLDETKKGKTDKNANANANVLGDIDLRSIANAFVSGLNI